jgi:hypothetical protein
MENIRALDARIDILNEENSSLQKYTLEK